MGSVFRGFKDFILRGNVVDLAVAVVIGAAFAGIVQGFTDYVLQPLINSFGSASGGELGFHIRANNDATLVNISGLIGVIVNFVIVAAVVYFFVVVPMTKLQTRRKAGVEPEPAAPPEDILLLQEIRDLLQQQNATVIAEPHGKHTDPPAE